MSNKVKYATGIDYVSGSLSKPKKKEGHKCGTYLIGQHRVAATTNPNCTRLYIRDAETYQRTKPYSNDERLIQTRFASVSAAVATRSKDLSKIAADQAAFEAQKNTPGGAKTLKAWYWMVEGEVYDQAHPRD